MQFLSQTHPICWVCDCFLNNNRTLDFDFFSFVSLCLFCSCLCWYCFIVFLFIFLALFCSYLCCIWPAVELCTSFVFLFLSCISILFLLSDYTGGNCTIYTLPLMGVAPQPLPELEHPIKYPVGLVCCYLCLQALLIIRQLPGSNQKHLSGLESREELCSKRKELVCYLRPVWTKWHSRNHF